MSARRSSLPTARKRITSVFTYLQELHRVRTPPIVHLDRYGWKRRLADIPSGSTVDWGPRLAAWTTSPTVDEGFLLRVARPREVACPPPPESFRARLQTGWDQPGQPAKLRAEQPVGVPNYGAPPASALPPADFEEWVRARDDWAREQAPVALFQQLYELWTKFERESEKYQLYIGDGILIANHDDGPVHHPVLLQRVDVGFDPRIPAFTLSESEDPPVLYAPMLRHLAVDGKGLLQLQAQFSEQSCDPFGGAESEAFLQQLVHGFWPDGEYAYSRDRAGRAGGPSIYRDPIFYLGHRSQDYIGAIDRYLDALPKNKSLPTALMRVVGIDDGEPSEPADDVDLLLTRPANAEQQRVLRRLAETGAVLVQGPPGTGKSHTIGNLIGHLLAQQKTILVTSQASKALRVVRQQVAAPLRSLCVSVLDSDEDSARQLEESITGILNYFSRTTADQLREQIEAIESERIELTAQQHLVAKALRKAIEVEYGDIGLDGDKVSTAEVVRELIEARGSHDWLPGPIDHTADVPLSDAEAAELYDLFARLPDDADGYRGVAVPDTDGLPAPDEFAEHCNQRTRLDSGTAGTAGLWHSDDQSGETLDALAAAVADAKAIFAHSDRWVVECMHAGLEGRETEEPWKQLALQIADCVARVPGRQTLVLEHGPTMNTDVPLAEATRIGTEIVEHLSAGKRLGRMATMLNSTWQAFIDNCRVDGKPPQTLEHFRALLDLLEIRSMRDALLRRWDRQMLPVGGPPATSLGQEPEKAAHPVAELIMRALKWGAERYRPMERALAQAGLDTAAVLASVARPSSPTGDIVQLRGVLCDVLPALIDERRIYLQAQALDTRRDAWLATLAATDLDADDGALVEQLTRSIRDRARETYARAHRRATELTVTLPELTRRDELLERLEIPAPAWAAALRERRAPHDGAIPGAGDAEAAWSYRRWAQQLAADTGADIDSVQTQLKNVSNALQDATARYVEQRSWEGQLGRTGLEEQQALAGWLALHKKIGKGSGKNAARLREEAKRTLVKCRQAVPVWIMPLSRVFESFDIATTHFDVIILDEASQCDIQALACFAMASEIAVVGDHEQVSPYAVGHKIDKIQGLIDELLDDIPNKQLYDGKTSVYDLARQSFGGTIRLLEHFRCVPEIVQFSNDLCYAGDIRPLRENSSARVGPPLVLHQVEGGRKDGKVNDGEAHEIAALVSAMCEMPEYDDCSIGVISMVGTEQALLVDSLLRRTLPVAEYKRRRLLCGNASQFQGDERDVILASIVSSPGARRLPIRQSEEAKKVFNVAVSRARDQLWVVHSLDPARDLKDGDLRLRLISHAKDPRVLRSASSLSAPRTPSTFERSLGDALAARGYAVTLHFPVGEHSVDVVVEGREGARVAVTCDGGRDITKADLIASMDHQITLERLGWRSIRVRASAYALAQDDTVDAICDRLTGLGIAPAGGDIAAAVPDTSTELRDRVLARAAQIVRGSRVTIRAATEDKAV